MTKIAIDRGTGNFILSDLAVLRLYLMGYEHIQIVAHGLGDMPAMQVDNTVSGMHAARMLSLRSMLELYEQDHTPKPLSDAPAWVTDCENIQALNRVIQMRGSAAIFGERVVIFDPVDDAMVEEDAWRTDPVLIQMIELIAEDASGSGSDLRVIEIPDGVDWGIAGRKGASEWIQELSIPQGSRRSGSYRKLRTWREPHCMPPKYGGAESMELPYVLAPDVTEEEWSYAMAMNFAGACPVPINIRPGNAMYPWDYERWFYWRMAQGDDWRERAKSQWWFNHVHK